MTFSPSTLGMSPARRRIFEAGARAAIFDPEAQPRRGAEPRARFQEEESLDAEAVSSPAPAASPHGPMDAMLTAAIAAAPKPVSAVSDATRIIRDVAAQHGLSVVALRSAVRTAKFVRARHEAMWRLREEILLSFPDIGRRLGGKDHTTAMWGWRAHGRRIAESVTVVMLAARLAAGEGR